MQLGVGHDDADVVAASAPRWMDRPIEAAQLLGQTLYWLFVGRRDPGALLAQMHAVGNRSAFFLSVTMGFIGVILVYQSGMQALRVLPDLSLLGATFAELLVRDLGPSIGAMPLATRVGAGIAAEMGSMAVTDQIDALRMSGAEPIDWLVVPRFVACVLAGSAVLIWGSAVAWVSAMGAAWVLFDVNPHTFANFALVRPADVVVGLLKCVLYGAAIAIVSAHCGLRARGGSEGVGRATTEAVVGSCLVVIVLNFAVSTTAYLLVPP
ncbi:MAG: ABC transporter permease [Myxococcota bacterium]|nr:ABC transporter permease [Myxococcota bacterium]MDW8362930.1 ABC transporter permease [Myxococcales bacterium]